MKTRAIKLLERLLNSSLPISTKQISKEYKVSERTIKNDIDEINDNFLLKYGFPLIENIRSKGVILNTDKRDRVIILDKLKIEFKENFLTRDERLKELFLSIIFSKDKVFLNKKREEYKVSKSTIDDDIKILRQLLDEVNLKIVSHPKNGLKIMGDELTIRSYTYKLCLAYFEKYPNSIQNNTDFIMSNYFLADDLNQVDRLFSKRIFDNDENIYRASMLTYTVIWVMRMQQGNFLSKSYSTHDSSSSAVMTFIDDIIENYQLDVNLEERNYISSVLDSIKHTNSVVTPNWGQIQLFILQLINYVSLQVGIPFGKKEKYLQENLYFHISNMLIRIKNGVQLINPLKDKIKETYVPIYEAVEMFCKNLEILLESQISEDEIAFITIHFSTVLSELRQQEDYYFRAVVVCNQGVATSKLLSENLKEYFDVEVLATLSSREIEFIDKLDIDLVFSTVNIDYYNKPLMILDPIIQDKTKIEITDFLNKNIHLRKRISKSQDNTKLFQEILKEVEKSRTIDSDVYNNLKDIFSSNGYQVNLREVQPVIRDILKMDNIIITEEKFNWEEAIEKVANPLVEKNIITSDYIDAMTNSVKEFGPYIVIGPHLALAHARPEDGCNELGLSLGIFKDPVEFGEEENQQVKVIFCLSAIDSFSHLGIMKDLVNLIRSTDKVEKLSHANSVEEVNEILFSDVKEEK
ncbi:BglG family transcription antiterminator [Streptococcus pluranimalium]|uniref:BglG family transcription antiterminator n=1 Tax=Streptococcus pluranimalium TaxID=82348 RepID=UPI0039FD0442